MLTESKCLKNVDENMKIHDKAISSYSINDPIDKKKPRNKAVRELFHHTEFGNQRGCDE